MAECTKCVAAEQHRDLTSRLGFGDGITEPQADNDTIIRALTEQRWAQEAAAVRDHAESLERIRAEEWRILCEVTGYEPDDPTETDPRTVYQEMVDQIRRPFIAAYATAAAERHQACDELAALRYRLTALADEWESGVWAVGNRFAANTLRAVLDPTDPTKED